MGWVVVATGSLLNRRSTLFLLAAAVVAVCWSLLLSPEGAQAQEQVALTPEQEARASDIYSNIMCPICDGQTISQSNADISVTMREMVRERLAAGDTNAEIYDFMAASFGQDILASPPTSGVGLAVWLIPPAALAAGAIVVAFVVRRLKAPPALAPVTVENDSQESSPELQTYLSLVDRELGGLDTPKGKH